MLGAFSLYFRGSVTYDGRALGLLGPGDFLLLRKNDGSVSVHGGTLIPPRNYMGGGTKMSGSIEEGKGQFTFVKKGEKIVVDIDYVHFLEPMPDWSEEEVKLRRTEKELVQKLFWNWPDYFDVECFSIETEVLTEHGPIDLLGTEFDRVRHVIEVKRRKGTVTDCVQLRKYVETFEEGGFRAHGYLAAPAIGDKAIAYLEKHGYDFVEVGFDV
jgi:RecB family endonuclease NucS